MSLRPYTDRMPTWNPRSWLRPFGGLLDDDWADNLFAALPRVRVDVNETPDEVVVRADVPGLERKEDVRITVDDHHLHLSGTIGRSDERHEGNAHRIERYYGHFSRSIPLPVGVREEGARASYRNGVLEVHLPKSETQRGRQIDVDFGER